MVFSEKLSARYRVLKEESPDCLLLMQVGTFTQVMDDDAKQVSTLIGIKLKMAGNVDGPTVVGGFPRSGLDQYVGKRVRRGHSVAIAFQGEDKEWRITEVVRLHKEKEQAHGPV